LTAEAIKAARQHGFLEEKDLWTTDQLLWNKLQSANHPEVRCWFELITAGTRFTWNQHQPLFRVACKVRSIDPPVIHGNLVSPYSKLDPAFSGYRNEYLSSKEGSWPMGIINAPGVSP